MLIYDNSMSNVSWIFIIKFEKFYYSQFRFLDDDLLNDIAAALSGKQSVKDVSIMIFKIIEAETDWER